MNLKTKLKIKSKTFGNTYEVVDEKTGKEFTINEYPPRQRTSDSAKYAVHEKYGNFIGKTRTFKGAKALISRLS